MELKVLVHSRAVEPNRIWPMLVNHGISFGDLKALVTARFGLRGELIFFQHNCQVGVDSSQAIVEVLTDQDLLHVHEILLDLPTNIPVASVPSSKSKRASAPKIFSIDSMFGRSPKSDGGPEKLGAAYAEAYVDKEDAYVPQLKRASGSKGWSIVPIVGRRSTTDRGAENSGAVYNEAYADEEDVYVPMLKGIKTVIKSAPVGKAGDILDNGANVSTTRGTSFIAFLISLILPVMTAPGSYSPINYDCPVKGTAPACIEPTIVKTGASSTSPTGTLQRFNRTCFSTGFMFTVRTRRRPIRLYFYLSPGLFQSALCPSQK